MKIVKSDQQYEQINKYNMYNILRIHIRIRIRIRMSANISWQFASRKVFDLLNGLRVSVSLPDSPKCIQRIESIRNAYQECWHSHFTRFTWFGDWHFFGRLICWGQSMLSRITNTKLIDADICSIYVYMWYVLYMYHTNCCHKFKGYKTTFYSIKNS